MMDTYGENNKRYNTYYVYKKKYIVPNIQLNTVLCTMYIVNLISSILHLNKRRNVKKQIVMNTFFPREFSISRLVTEL